MKKLPQLSLCVLLFFAILPIAAVKASVWYIDFESGKDSNAGHEPTSALQHCPGDPDAKGNASAAKLQPGDKVIFKGGVSYKGSFEITASGNQGNPIVFDGNTEGTFGTGKAIIEGAELLTGWKRCASAAEVKGNPRWAEIYYVDIPKPKAWWAMTLCDETRVLPFAQMPKMSDPFFQESQGEFYQSDEPLKSTCPASIKPEAGTYENSSRPLVYMITKNAPFSATISPAEGGSYSVNLAAPTEIHSVGMTVVTKGYALLKEVAFYGDDKQLLKVTLDNDKKEMQKFVLPQPATIKKFTVKQLSVYEKNPPWNGVVQLAAFDSSGKNILEISPEECKLTLVDTKNLTQPEDYYKGAWCSFICNNNNIYYLPIKSYDPKAHQLTMPMFMGKFYKKTQYSFLNSTNLINLPGEYCVEIPENSQTARIFILPPKVVNGAPDRIKFNSRDKGVFLNGAGYVTLQGLVIRGQSSSALKGGNCNHLVVRDCEVAMARDGQAGPDGGAAVSFTNSDTILFERNYVHHNPGHTRGLCYNKCSNAITRECKIISNSGTGIDYYNCTDGQVLKNLVLDQNGQHSNGVTFYVYDKNMLMKDNYVSGSKGGGCPLTFKDIENFVVCNNLLDANYHASSVGVWPGSLKNITFYNNALVRSTTADNYSAGLFTSCKDWPGLVMKNNIIDGLYADDMGKPLSSFNNGVVSNNIFTRKTREVTDAILKNNSFEPDIKKIFVDPDKNDFRPKPGGPAAGKGISLPDVQADLAGKKRKATPDIGPYEAD